MKAAQSNDSWQRKRLEEGGPGAAVTLPHDAMPSEPQSELSAGASTLAGILTVTDRKRTGKAVVSVTTEKE